MTLPIPKDKPDLRPKLRDLPHKPGVYLMRDRFRRVIYVGKARDLRKRVSQYFMASKRRTADLKTRALLDSVWDLEWHTVRSEPEALLLEGRLIKEFRPKYNVSFRDDKRFLMVKVDLAEEWPRFRLARFRRDDQARYFGPYANAGALRQTLHFMRKRFGILTSGYGVPGEKELKSSAFQVLMKLNQFAVEAYRERVLQACEFLDGQSRDLLAELEEEMKKAAGRLDFERAAELRNMLDNLRATTAPVRRFTGYALLPSTVDPLADMRELQNALDLEKEPRVMECFDISNISSTHIVASMVCFRNGAPDKASYRRYRITSVAGQDDFASMGEVIRRRYERILREAGRLPDLVIVDGGRGQLSSACRELGRLELGALPIIGLAKEFEEIYRPGELSPLLLSPSSPALRLLQRIRDEAHRFANGYHQLLMKRRISESILDDCPGVSEARKAALLKQFGSVARLRRAAVEEIAQLPGISARLAGQIVEYLQARSAGARERP